MPFFSRRKSGKQKVNKHGTGQQSTKAQTNTTQKLKQPSVGASFNGITTTPDLPRKDLYEAVQRSAHSTAKCVANFPRRSRLSKSLPEVLVDDSILPLFLEFLHRQGAQNILNFWLSAETFRLSSRDKTLFSYKSRVKLKSKQQSASKMEKLNIQNDSKHGLPAFEMKTNRSSSLTNLQSSPSFSSSDTNDCNSVGSKPGNLESRQTTIDEPDTGQSKTGSEMSRAVFTPSSSNTKNQALFDSSHKESSVYNLTSSNSTLPGLSEDNNSRLGLPVNTEHSPCSTDVSRKTVLVTSNSHNDNRSSQEDLSLDNRNKNETSTSDENATRIFQLHDKNELTRQESRETRERRRRSKVMMDDALSIYRHFISLDATQPLGVDENIRREVESNICSENGVIDPECFKVAQKFAFNTLQNRYFDDFIRSSYYQKHIMDILTSGKVFLADIMYNDSAMFYFMEFMEQEEKSYLLAFWIAVDSFCQELQSKLDKKEYNADEALEDAMVLYDKYFSMQASNSLGVSDETRIRIENKICREEGPLPDCFEEPMENVLTLLEEVYFPIFLDSDVYMKYLNELFSAVTDVDSDHTSIDDCSSTASANETSKLMESLVDDVEPHDDPDEIWQRPRFGLSIGRVNEFGIYEPGIEPQPGKEALKFGQKMKKLVSGDSDKMKEEMAWKVAKMVLEDVKKQQKKAR